MALIGTSTGGTSVINLDYTPEFIQVINTSTNQSAVITSFSVSVAGKEIINLSNQYFLDAYGVWLTCNPQISNVATSDVTLKPLSVANGNLPNQQTQVRLTLPPSETYEIYGFSTDFGSDVVIGATNSINASANALVSDFDLLLIEQENFANADVTFANGFTDRYDINDLRSLLTLSGQFNYSGYMEADTMGTPEIYILAINNLSLFNERVASVRLYAKSTGILNFATVKAPR